MFDYKEVRRGIADLTRADYTTKNGVYVLIGGHLWRKSERRGNNPMTKVCTSDEFRDYMLKNYRHCDLDYELHLDGESEQKIVTVRIGYFSFDAGEVGASVIYREPFVFDSSDAERCDIWDSLGDDQKNDIEEFAFLACGYHK